MNTELFETIDSTNDYLKAKSANGSLKAKDGVIAFSQTKGRGRLGRSFESPKGGIYISFCYGKINSRGAAEHLSLMPAAAGVVSLFIKKYFGIDTYIKWPNDVFLNGKKCSGILCERTSSGDLIIGVGLNYKTSKFDPSFADKATSLFFPSSLCPPPEEVGKNLLDALRNVQPFASDSFMFEYYNKVLLYKGENITLKTIYNNELVSGICLGININGELMLKTSDSSINCFSIGELTAH